MPFSGLTNIKRAEPERVTRTREMLESGMRAAEIADALGLTLSAVRSMMRRHGLKSPPLRKDVPFCYDDLYRLVCQLGPRPAEISQTLGVSRGLVIHYVNRDYGVTGLMKFKDRYEETKGKK